MIGQTISHYPVFRDPAHRDRILEKLGHIVILLLWMIGKLHAQEEELKFEHFTTDDGLGHNQVTCLLQDRRGFLWIGTLGGLWRYEGYGFKFARYAHDDSTGLSYPEIQSLCEDSQGHPWVGMQRGGLNLFNREAGTSVRYQHDPADPNSLSDGALLTIHEEQSKPGVLWIGTTTGLCRMTREADGKTRYLRYQHEPGNDNSLGHNEVHTISQDSSGIFWIGTGDGLDRFDSKAGVFTHYKPHISLSEAFHDHAVRSLVNDGDSLLWLGTDNGLNKFNLSAETFTRYRHDPKNPYSLSDDRISSICQDQSGILWIATTAGLNRFDPQTEMFTSYHHDPDDPHSLSSDGLLSICQDRSGVLWVGTASSGLDKLPFQYKNFKHYKRRKNVPNSLNDNGVSATHEDRSGRLWVGTASGLNIFDERRQTVFYYQHDPSRPESSLSDNMITAIMEDRSGRFWIGTANGLNRFDPQTGTSRQYTQNPSDSNSLSHSYISRLHEGPGGALWVGTNDGLNKLVLETDEKTGKERARITRYYPDPVNPNKTSDNWISAIYEDRHNIVLIGTREGLTEFDQNTGALINYRFVADDPHSLSYNNVWGIYEDSSGVLWVGTADMLDKLDRESRTFEHFDPFAESRGYGVGGLLEDAHGNLWFYTSRGLATFHRQTGSFRHYDVLDGLQSNTFTRNAHYKSRDGEMFYGGKNGFNAFFPEEIQDNPHIPPIVFTNFRLLNQSISPQSGNVPLNITIGWSPNGTDGKPILQKSISETKEIVLSYQDNTFSIEFSALDFIAPHKNQYAYKLEGSHRDWLYWGSERSITFTNLPHGIYNLRVKGSNNDGVWNEEGTELKIIITPPWWKTWWAYTLYAMLVLATLYGIRRYELNRLRLKDRLRLEKIEAEKLKELDHLKSRFFANISHEFRTPLTLILGPLENLLQNTVSGVLQEQYEIMLRNGRRLLQLINQLLDLAKLEAGSMALRARPENVVHLLKLIIASFQSLAERKRIALRFHSPEDSASASGLEIPPVYLDRDKFEKIISNLIANAIKFTPEGGEISVQLSVSSDQLSVTSNQLRRNQLITGHWTLITVKDTGIGIPANELDKIFDRFYQVNRHQHEVQGTGIGLALTKELVQLHGGEIHVHSEVGKGSTFVVRLPLGKEHLKPEEIVEAGDQSSVISEQLSVSSEQLSVASGTQPATSNQQRVTNNEQQATSDQETVLLIVEDNPDMRAYLRGILGKSYRLMEAGDGEEGLRQAAAAMPDLIVSDVMMPKMDGFAFCQKIKTDERTSHIPVILLTARASGESKIEGLETGADDYLTKPFNARELQVRVQNLIQQRRRLRERFSREVTLQPRDIAITTMDELFLQRVMTIVDAHLSDADFSVEAFAEEVKMSRVQLHRKIKALTNQSASEFIRTLRLRAAAKLLEQHKYTISEVAYQVGFNNLSYFARCFRDEFGRLPSEYAALPGHEQE